MPEVSIATLGSLSAVAIGGHAGHSQAPALGYYLLASVAGGDHHPHVFRYRADLAVVRRLATGFDLCSTLGTSELAASRQTTRPPFRQRLPTWAHSAAAFSTSRLAFFLVSSDITIPGQRDRAW